MPSRIKCFSPTALALPLCDALNILKKPVGDALYFHATLLKTMQFAVVPVSFNECAKSWACAGCEVKTGTTALSLLPSIVGRKGSLERQSKAGTLGWAAMATWAHLGRIQGVLGG